MHSVKRKRVFVPLALILAVAMSAAAVAFWTASGTGSGTASVGTDAGVSITLVSFTGTLYPGASVPVSFTVNNLSPNTPVKVGKVITDTSFGGGTGITGLPSGCLPADFTFGDVAVNTEIPISGSLTGSGTLTMANTAANQNACKNQSPVLRLKVDNSGI